MGATGGGSMGAYYNLLQQFDQKAIPDPTSDNTQIQKVSAPTDSATLDDGNAVTWSVASAPFKYGAAKYGASTYGA